MQYGKIGKSVLRHRRSEPVSDSSHHWDLFIFTLITNNLALTYSLKYDNANKMRQCENIFVFIDLTKSIGSDLGGQCPPRPPPNSAYARHPFRTAYLRFILIENQCFVLFAGSEQSMCNDADKIYSSQTEQAGCDEWQIRIKMECECDVIEGRSTIFLFFVLCLFYHFKWQTVKFIYFSLLHFSLC